MKGLYRFHQGIVHFSGGIRRNMLEADTSGTNNPIDISGCILRIIGFLYMNFFRFICNLNIRIHIKKQPERNVDTFDLIDMIFFSEYLRQIFSFFQMRIISFFGSFFVQLERDDIIRLKIPGKLPLRSLLYYYRTGRSWLLLFHLPQFHHRRTGRNRHAYDCVSSFCHWPLLRENQFSFAVFLFGCLFQLPDFCVR